MNLKLKLSCLALILCLATSAIHAVETPRLNKFFQKSNLFNELSVWESLTPEQQQNFIAKLTILKDALIKTIDDLGEGDISCIIQNFDPIQNEPETKEEIEARLEAQKSNPYIY